MAGMFLLGVYPRLLLDAEALIGAVGVFSNLR
jgi:hypothetical protein